MWSSIACNWIDPDFDLNINWYETLVFLHFAQPTIHYLHWARKPDPVLVAIESITWWQIKYQSVFLTLYHHLELFCHPNFAIADSCKFDRPLLTPQIEVANDDKGYYLFEGVGSCKLQNSILVTSDEVDANLQNPKGIAFKFSMITFAPE